ncbi:MAG TPA: transcriptional regulator NrdR [Streptosporangiaceae bacterium]|jgi:transcriptional repressor NrdR|nr:transcriptional regulator NrdR [Streptosporangiaceae bacterium]
MYCPYCRHSDSRVIDSRTSDDGAAIRRRRACPECGRRFTTQETVILTVAKRSGVTEPFNRDKIVRGVRRACQGRPVTEDQLAFLAQQVEEVIRSRGSGEIPSHEVGLAILGPLRDLDEVAYLRFASVYRGFESLSDFEQEIAALRAAHLDGWRPEDVQFLATEAELRPDGERGTGLRSPAGNRAARQPGQQPAPTS